MGANKHAAYNPALPEWVNNLEAAPRPRAMFIGISAALAITTIAWAWHLSSVKLPQTMSREWKAKNREYAEFHKINPIFGPDAKRL